MQHPQLNKWIGLIFMIGASLFALGSLFYLAPSWAAFLDLTPEQINPIFFAGSIPFTAAAYLQLFQAANSGGGRLRYTWIGWQPKNADWMSASCQFVGTLLFNVNTFDAMLPDLNRVEQNIEIWVPDFIGSILFLISGYIALVHIKQHSTTDTQMAVVNFLGCVAFMASACFAFVPANAPSFDAAQIATITTLLGAMGFWIGAALLWRQALKH